MPRYKVDGHDEATDAWRSIVVEASGPNDAEMKAVENGLRPSLVHALDEPTPEETSAAKRKRSTLGNRVSLLMGALGGATLITAVLVGLGPAPAFGLAMGIFGVAMVLYAIIGLMIFPSHD